MRAMLVELGERTYRKTSKVHHVENLHRLPTSTTNLRATVQNNTELHGNTEYDPGRVRRRIKVGYRR